MRTPVLVLGIIACLLVAPCSFAKDIRNAPNTNPNITNIPDIPGMQPGGRPPGNTCDAVDVQYNLRGCGQTAPPPCPDGYEGTWGHCQRLPPPYDDGGDDGGDGGYGVVVGGGGAIRAGCWIDVPSGELSQSFMPTAQGAGCAATNSVMPPRTRGFHVYFSIGNTLSALPFDPPYAFTPDFPLSGYTITWGGKCQNANNGSVCVIYNMHETEQVTVTMTRKSDGQVVFGPAKIDAWLCHGDQICVIN